MSYIKASSPKEQEYFDFIEELRQSGDTNMFDAAPYLEQAFPELDRPQAHQILGAWMKGHDDPSRILSGPASARQVKVNFETRACVTRKVRR